MLPQRTCFNVGDKVVYQWNRGTRMSFGTSSVTGPIGTDGTSEKVSECQDVTISSENACLTSLECEELKKCEDLIQIGLSTFFEIGKALLTIRQRRLYRATHATFESYCLEKWQIGRSYAFRMIGAAERLMLLRSGTEISLPSNEYQIRPFLRLPPERFVEAWRQAVQSSGDGRVTSKVGQRIVDEISPRKTIKRPVKSLETSRPRLPLGQILVLLHGAKKKIEEGNSEHALDCLDRIEHLLFNVSEENPVAENPVAESNRYPGYQRDSRILKEAPCLQ